jgi:uncharacterized protein YjbJ (UPF0337 family)
MNKMSLRGNWNEIKGKLKQKYANLTDDDLRFIEGKEEELLGRLQQCTGQTRENCGRKSRNSDLSSAPNYPPIAFLVLPGVSALCQVLGRKHEPLDTLTDGKPVYNLGHVRDGDAAVEKVIGFD